MRFRELTELFEPATKEWEWQRQDQRNATAVFEVDGIHYVFNAEGRSLASTSWDVIFKINDKRALRQDQERLSKFGIAGTGNSAAVMGTVVDILRDFLRTYKDHVTELTFTANDASRKSLYARMVQRLLPSWELATSQSKHGGQLDFTLTKPTNEVIESDTPIKLTSNAKAKGWIDKVYARYPQMFQRNHVMPLGGTGNDQQFAMFELTPSFAKRDAVEVTWIQAHPMGQGVGARAMKELQALATADGISLTLFPWDKGQVSHAKLTKFYKGQGFKPTAKGSRNMTWSPITELFEPVTKNWSWTTRNSDEAIAVFNVEGIPYKFNAYLPDDDTGVWDIVFELNDKRAIKADEPRLSNFGLSGSGNAAQVMGTIVDILRDFMKIYKNITAINFTAQESSRQSLYTRMIMRLLPGWTLTSKKDGIGQSPDSSEFTVTAPINEVIIDN